LANTKISAGADPVILAATDLVPMARSGSTTAYAATMAEVVTWTNTGLPYEVAVATSPGIASAGTVASVSRGDHVHPFDNTRVSKSGDAMTGLLTGTVAQFNTYTVTASGPTWTTGTAAPSSTQPVGSLYSRVGGAVGATLYVSRGGGTWAAVAGV
jgi:hypothetical protein